MGDGWKDNALRSLINFLVYSLKGICFLNSVDVFYFVTNTQTLCNLFIEIIEIVGPNNVVHIVTDNESNYRAAGKLICEKYHTISRSLCEAHCLSLILKDIPCMSHVKNLADHASSITVFVYNHK
ncbi:hypothetical protein AXF42_Ash001185 [Apostasia shenzhenica]|uniref:DUF659 domain-containing protein n=1 Tax=Apostasia shenzhenica TaxID=1088818 RepID=A0A2I0AU87_9ASPA|nr:hypothetical protein AXF42_Ash001185 [Apostasia shenzhenica]